MLLKTAKKYNINFAPIKISKDLKKNLPAWSHIGTPTNAYHKAKTKCLNETHKSTKIKNLIKIRKRLTHINDEDRHFPRKNCPCSACQKDRRIGCKDPHKCAQTANEILFRIAPKFNTKAKPKKDGLSLTRRRKEKNHQAHKSRQGEILFDPTTTIRSNLKDCFRIFSNPEHNSLTPAHRLQAPARGLNLLQDHITIFTDGSCINNGKENSRSGGGIWLGENHPKNLAFRIPGNKHSNQIAEISAI
ncbi:hypothetical protein C8R48DRAFT_617993, partial [Suillus tomentosus]